MRSAFLPALVCWLACAHTPPRPSAREASPQVLDGRAVIDGQVVTELRLFLPSGSTLIVRPLEIVLQAGRYEVVRRDPHRPAEPGVTVEWITSPRELWVGEAGELFVDTFECSPSTVPGAWVGTIGGALTVRLIRAMSAEWPASPYPLAVRFRAGLYNQGGAQPWE